MKQYDVYTKIRGPLFEIVTFRAESDEISFRGQVDFIGRSIDHVAEALMEQILQQLHPGDRTMCEAGYGPESVEDKRRRKYRGLVHDAEMTADIETMRSLRTEAYRLRPDVERDFPEGMDVYDTQICGRLRELLEEKGFGSLGQQTRLALTIETLEERSIEYELTQTEDGLTQIDWKTPGPMFAGKPTERHLSMKFFEDGDLARGKILDCGFSHPVRKYRGKMTYLGDGCKKLFRELEKDFGFELVPRKLPAGYLTQKS